MAKIAVVNSDDQIIGSEERKIVYQKGLIHRLVRVILINTDKKILLQWRSANEDTFPNTWDQSAGGHVDEGEDYLTAAKRELSEELGVNNAELTLIDSFFTNSTVGEKIIKRFNSVFLGRYSGDFTLQTEEVEKVEWFNFYELQEMIKSNPELFTPGLITVLSNKRLLDSI